MCSLCLPTEDHDYITNRKEIGHIGKIFQESTARLEKMRN
jgi:hypothetical protein